jgi:hypothetical protein
MAGDGPRKKNKRGKRKVKTKLNRVVGAGRVRRVVEIPTKA